MASSALVHSSSTGSLIQTQAGKNGSVTPAPKASPSLPLLNLTPKKDVTPVKRAGSANVQGGTPGRWMHPRVAEVIERRNATNFDSSNVRTIAYSIALVIVSFYSPGFLQTILPSTWHTSLHPYPTFALTAFQLLLLLNIALACLPLTRSPDMCEDIPLTPSQRRLLGLPPMSRPATPQEQAQYVTPPRFARNSTPRSTSSSLFAETGGSPLGAYDSNNSPFSPFRGSPTSGFDARPEGRRLSFASNRSSPLSVSDFDAVGSASTPTKATRASVGLNSKWLYEKGRGSPRASLGASGRSVF